MRDVAEVEDQDFELVAEVRVGFEEMRCVGCCRLGLGGFRRRE